MLKANQSSLDKLQELFEAITYKVRFEKGNFKSGACVLENSRVVVVNKFATLESKINALVEILLQIEVDESLFDEKEKALYNSLKQTKLQL